MFRTIYPDAGIVSPDADVVGDVLTDFAVAARSRPEHTALIHNGTPTTFGELAEHVRDTAIRYRSRGFDAGLVGVLVDHTPSMVTQLLGVLQAGATYCPIDSALPLARKQALSEALGVDRLFASAARSVAGVRTDTVDAAGPVPDPLLPQRIWHGQDAAYVLCTSGSTGLPKPVVVPRHALTVTVRALRALFELTPADRVLQFASLSWDTSFEEILPTMTAGATLVFDDAAHSGAFGPFIRMLAERKITVLDLPTAFWHELVLHLHESGAALPDTVRLVVIGGERVDPTRLRQWRSLGVGHVRLLNTYGCTETTMITHAVTLNGPGTESSVLQRTQAPLGRPLPHVVDHVTAQGELLVSGPSLATGYLGLPIATAASFGVLDHGTGPARWFRTGDLVSRDDDTLLHGLGRADEQLKVSGVRIHPAEVEIHLRAHPDVAGAVVLGEQRLGRTALTAYVVASGSTTTAELRRFLGERLPRQFVPTRFIFVAALSYTTSGKVDRAAMRRIGDPADALNTAHPSSHGKAVAR
ncbi:amino acid adenylation domain-containing protein [Gordonia sp. TBRC 11910]|uniref:Amino acid adenylation domain-containing protein n=1 Tax=Gordonia asplenii TaxID=2725283 RepID=A0A848KNN5_9ACTN|nr:AMP-binding protein [Gordonia asplenii]NMN99841.1 amino acid adenylation domain-containing protein [Gordonia asplenii]